MVYEEDLVLCDESREDLEQNLRHGEKLWRMEEWNKQKKQGSYNLASN